MLEVAFVYYTTVVGVFAVVGAGFVGIAVHDIMLIRKGGDK